MTSPGTPIAGSIEVGKSEVCPRRRTSMKKIVALLIGLALLGFSEAGWAEPTSRESGGNQVVLGAGSVLGTLVYAPVKASFCILGGISSGFAFPIAGPQTAGNIAGSTCKGTWVITPSALEGKERVKFLGDTS
jgi:4-hydroxybenzoate polyprenyltransferase